MNFFEQLRTFSIRYFNQIGITERSTPWGPDEYEGGNPKGAIMHFTADNDIERVVKFFMRERYQAKASANVVIGDQLLPSAEGLTDGLPLVAELPVTVIQCALPETPTWHATWASYHTYGIELLNVGELRIREDGWVSHWRRDHDPEEEPWTMPWPTALKEPVRGWERFWEPYTSEQVVAVVAVLRHLRERYPVLDPSWVLGHEAVQGIDTQGARGRDKRDPGPHLPIRHIRRAMFEDTETGFDARWIKEFEDENLAKMDRDLTIQTWAAVESGLLPSLPGIEGSWLRFGSALQALQGGKGPFGTTGKAALRLLGYHIPRIHPDMDDADKQAVWLFQKLSGLKADRIPGSRTRAALQSRLLDRGIL